MKGDKGVELCKESSDLLLFVDFRIRYFKITYLFQRQIRLRTNGRIFLDKITNSTTSQHRDKI